MKKSRKKKSWHRVYQGTYKGIQCDSAWELAYVLYNFDHNIKFYRCNQKFPYTWYRKTRYYYPDFILDDGTYVEIKGILSGQDARKLEWFPHNLLLLGPKEMKPILDYVIMVYGKEYHILLDNKKVVAYKK